MVTREEIEELVKSKNIYKLLELSKDVDLCPICIPSYKFRKNAYLLKHLDEIHSKVYLFLYDDDYVESGYDKYPFPENVEIVKISREDFEKYGLEWRGLSAKLHYMQLWLKNNGISKFFRLDDDLEKFFIIKSQRNNNCHSNYIEEISIESFLKIMQLISNIYPEYKLLGCETNVLGFKFYTYNSIFKNALFIQVMLFNDFPLMFTPDNNCLEDVDLYLRCIIENIKVGAIKFILCKAVKCYHNDSVANDPEIHNIRFTNVYMLYPQYLDLFLYPDGLIGVKVNQKKIKNNNKDIDNNLFEMCKNKNFDAIKKYIRDNDKKLDINVEFKEKDSKQVNYINNSENCNKNESIQESILELKNTINELKTLLSQNSTVYLNNKHNSLESKKTIDIVVDYDNTIILHNGSNVVDEGIPNIPLINELNRLHDIGYRILIFTSRGHISAASRADAEIKYRSRIEKVLNDYGLKYDLLSFNKPYACIYIDDSAIRPNEIERLKELT